MSLRMFWTRLLWAAMLSLGLAVTSSAQSTSGEPAEPPSEQEADRQGAVAGEAPPADVQSERSPEGEEREVERDKPAPPSRTSAVKPRPGDAREHLARIDAIIDEILAGRPKDAAGGEPVGTTGTPITEPSGQVLAVERAKLEEIRLHLEQVRTALGGP